MKTQTILALAFLLALPGFSGATEYFVGKNGGDANDGLSPGKAFLTIQRGVDALAPGDALTIGPGEYLESVARENLGGPDAYTVIRAALPGTVLLRGDTPAPEFRPVPGYRFVYAAEFPATAQAVNELDTLRILESVPNPRELEFLPGGFHYDEGSRTLYISTSDLQPPARHRYTVSVLEGSGIYLVNPDRVVLEGLAATGFQNAAVLPSRRGGHMSGDYLRHGFYLWRARRSTIRDCRAYLNGAGITILTSREGGGNLVERSTAWANYSKHGLSIGNIAILDWSEDAVRDCVAYRGERHGIRLYGSGGVGLLRDNLSWGHRGADFQIKGGEGVQLSRAERCLAPRGAITAPNAFNCLVDSRDDTAGNNIVFSMAEGLDPAREFADPANFDYRLQATSRFRGAGAGGADRGPFPYRLNIFYLAPDGDDAADGLSAARAWRTLGRALPALRAGDTLYLAGGRYDSPGVIAPRGEPGRPVAIRGRGRAPAVIAGHLFVRAGAELEFARLEFAGPVSVAAGRDISFDNCRFAWAGESALTARETRGLAVTQSAFTGFVHAALDLAGTDGVFLRGNSFDNRHGAGLRLDRAGSVRYSDYNAYLDRGFAWQAAGARLDLAGVRALGHERYASAGDPAEAPGFAAQGPFARSVGPWHETDGEDGALCLAGPFVHSVTDTTANLEWWASGPTEIRAAWGERADGRLETAAFEAHRFGSFSLTGLKPGTEYHFRLTLDRPLTPLFPDQVEPVAPGTVALTFRTAAAPAAPVVYYVAPDGDDAADGLSRARAWRTVSRAADRARPGDTVMIAGGTYTEIVRVRATGERGRPITFRALPGEKVVFDGAGRTLDCAFLATGKHHLRFDGFYFTRFMNGSPNMPWSDRIGGANGAFVIYRGRDIEITRCFHDSRGPGYGPGLLYAFHSADILLRNNVITGSMGGGVSFAGCPGMRLENNVFLRNLISQIGEVVNEPGQKFTVERNIITDSIASKVGGVLIPVGKIESFIERDNCYYLRIPAAERRLFMFYEPDPAYRRSALAYRLATEFAEPPVITERAQISLPEYQRRYNPDSGSVAADPLFRATLGWERTDAAGQPVFLGDRLSGKSDLDFPDLFATNPELVGRGIGLQPEAFADFHFNKP